MPLLVHVETVLQSMHVLQWRHVLPKSVVDIFKLLELHKASLQQHRHTTCKLMHKHMTCKLMYSELFHMVASEPMIGQHLLRRD